MSIDIDKQMEVARTLNATLEQMNKITNCGPECQKKKKTDELKLAYEQALINDENSKTGEAVRDARKQYFTYAFGKSYYNSNESQRLQKESDTHIQRFQKAHDFLKNEINKEVKEKKENKMAIHRMRELLNKYNTKNEELINSMDNKENVLETAQRRVFYTAQKLGWWEYYGYIFEYILRVLLFLTIIYFMYVKKYLSLAVIIVVYLLMRHFS